MWKKGVDGDRSIIPFFPSPQQKKKQNNQHGEFCPHWENKERHGCASLPHNHPNPCLTPSAFSNVFMCLPASKIHKSRTTGERDYFSGNHPFKISRLPQSFSKPRNRKFEPSCLKQIEYPAPTASSTFTVPVGYFPQLRNNSLPVGNRINVVCEFTV